MERNLEIQISAIYTNFPSFSKSNQLSDYEHNYIINALQTEVIQNKIKILLKQNNFDGWKISQIIFNSLLTEYRKK